MLKTVAAGGGGVCRAVRWCSGSGGGDSISADSDRRADGGAVDGEAAKTSSGAAENVGHAMRLLTLHPAELKLTKDVEVRRMLSVRHDPAKEEPKWRVFGANASVDAAVAQQELLRRDMDALERLASVELGPRSYAEAIRALCKRGDTHKALFYVRHMEREGLPLQEEHASPLLSALAKRNLTEKAVAVFRKAKGCRSTRVYNALLPLFIRLYDMRAASKGSDGSGCGGDGAATPLRKTRWLDVLFEQEGAPVPPRDTHTYYHLLRHACTGVDDVACVRRAMAENDAALPFSSIHVQAVLIGAARWLAVPSSPSRTRQEEVVAAADGEADERRAIVRYAEELVEAVGDDVCDSEGDDSAEHENQLKYVPKSPTLYSLLMTVHRNGGLSPGSSDGDAAEALTKIRALFARIDRGTRLPSTYAVMLTSLACAAEGAEAGVVDKEALIREGEAVFAEARRSRDEVLSNRRVWTAMMRLYASSARPRTHRRAAEELMLRFLLSEAPDDHTIRAHLAAVCGGQRKLPGFVPPKLTDRQKVRMRPRLLRRAQERVAREAARVKAAAAERARRAAREKQERQRRDQEEKRAEKTRRQPVYSDGFEELLQLLK